MLIRTLIIALALASCAQDVELNPLPEESWTRQESTVCDLRRYLCDPYDPEANWRCNSVCGWPGHCLDYSAAEIAYCEFHPHSYYRGGYCNPFGEPTWPTHCVDGPVP